MGAKQMRYPHVAAALATTVVCLLTLALESPWLSFAGASTTPPREAPPSTPPCGPAGAMTMSIDGGMRIFRRENPDGTSSATFACSRSSRGAVKLGRTNVRGPFAITPPWAAGVEYKPVGQDSVKVSIVGASVVSARTGSCLIGGADRPGQLPKVDGVWISLPGKLVVSATLRVAPKGPEIAVCTPGGPSLEVIASGEAIEPESVAVRGSVVSWSEEGKRRAKQL